MIRKIFHIIALLFASLQTFAQTTYTYDNLYRLTKVTYGNGVTVSYTYDALGNRTGKKVTGATSTTYAITVSVTPTGSGSVTGGGTYSKGTLVELNAIPNAGYEFSKWSDGVTSNPRTVTVTNNQSFTAQFVQSTVIPDLAGDIVVDGKVNLQDLSALVNAYLNNTQVTQVTDLDSDGSLTIADISSLISIINENNSGDINGHEYVDLGLPSGTLWATCNVGASTPEEAGCYYATAETFGSCDGKSNFSLNNYKYWDNETEGLTKYSADEEFGSNGFTDDLTSLEIIDDAATANWGSPWRTPTKEDFQELKDERYTTWEWTTKNGTPGVLFKSIVSGYVGNSVFFPAKGSYDDTEIWKEGVCGWYMSSTYDREENYFRSLYFQENKIGIGGQGNRSYGQTIRPVLFKNVY